MAVIGTNVASIRAANASTAANQMLQTSMERLSTGQRINSAKDDAAGMAISDTMTAQIRGMNQGIRNANDGIAMAQTAEGALGEVANMLQRVRELTVQATSGTYSSSDKTNMQAEVSALKTQITSTLANTQFNGNKLFDATAGTVNTSGSPAVAVSSTFKIQAGANAADAVSLTFNKLTNNASLTAVIGDATAPAPAPVPGIDLTTADNSALAPPNPISIRSVYCRSSSLRCSWTSRTKSRAKPSRTNWSVTGVMLPPVTIMRRDKAFIFMPSGTRSSCAIRSKRGSVVLNSSRSPTRTLFSMSCVQVSMRNHKRKACGWSL